MRFSVCVGHAEYSVFTRVKSPFWQVKFWDYERKKWTAARSTKIKNTLSKSKAEQAARQLLAAGVLTAAGAADIGFTDYLTSFWKPSGDYSSV